MTNSTVIRSLAPFTTYSYSVAAVTIAGIGPYSSISTVLTDEAGMCTCSTWSCMHATANMFHVYHQIIPLYKL